MWALTFFRGIGKYIAVAAVALAALFAFGKSKEVKGRKQERAKQTEKIHAKAKTAKKVRRAVRADPGKRDSVSKFDRDG